MDVICAVDGSPVAPGVVRYAANIASRAGAALRIVRAAQVADPLFVTGGVARAMEDPAERRERVIAVVKRQLEDLAAGIEGMEATPELRQGSPVNDCGGILAVAPADAEKPSQALSRAREPSEREGFQSPLVT